MDTTIVKQHKIGKPTESLVNPLITAMQKDIKGHSLWADAGRRYYKNKGAMISLIVLIVMILAIIIGPWFSPYTIQQTDWGAIYSPPSIHHIFGTDDLGRDLFTGVTDFEI